MASGVRTRRAPTQLEVDVSDLNNLERLIFAQAVHELGPDAWPKVCELLAQHPMILKPRSFFTLHSCRVIFTQLLKDAGLECPEDVKPRSEVLLRLAQRHYGIRLTELKELIAAEEAKFKTLVSEIDEIRGGLWDDKILGKPAENPPSREKSPAAVEELLQGDSHQDVASGASQPQSPVPDDVALAAEQKSVEPEIIVISESTDTVVHEPLSEELVADGTAEHPLEIKQPAEDPEPEIAESAEKTTDNIAEGVTVATPATELMETDGVEADHEPTQAAPSVSPPADPLESTMEDMAEQIGQQESPQDVPAPASELPADSILQDKPIDADVEMAEADLPPTVANEEPRIDKRKASEVETIFSDSQREKKRAREESETADDDEAGMSSGPKARRGRPTAADSNPVVSKRFQNVISMLHSQISQHRFGNVFQYPIKKSEAPDYHDIVKRPMDLKTIKARIKDGLISNSTEFQRDVFLMFANAMMYNRPGSEIYNMAEEMMLSSEAQIRAFRQTEGYHRS